MAAGPAAGDAEGQPRRSEPARDEIFAEVDALNLSGRQDGHPPPPPAAFDQQPVAVERKFGTTPPQAPKREHGEEDDRINERELPDVRRLDESRGEQRKDQDRETRDIGEGDAVPRGRRAQRTPAELRQNG